MAQVFKCDRCGQYENKDRFSNKGDHSHTVRYWSQKDLDEDDRIIKQFELCETCFAQVKNVLTNPPIELSK